MVYVLEPVIRKSDPAGFTVATGGFKSSDRAIKRQFKPVPSEQLPKRVKISGKRPMPDFFSLAADHYYVSSRFRSVLEQYAAGAVEYLEVEFDIPTNKNPADAYYFINVQGRSQLMDWELTAKTPPAGDGCFFFWDGAPDRWVMRTPPVGHVAIWHETDRIETDAKYFGSGRHVFVTNELGDALNAAFSRQCVLSRLREV